MMPGSPLVRRRSNQGGNTPTRLGRGTWSLAGMVHGVSRPRSQLVIKILIAATLTTLCMVILRQYDSAGTVDKVWKYKFIIAVAAVSSFVESESSLLPVSEKHGIAVRSGHHCAQPLHHYLGINASAQASLYFYNTTEEVDAFIAALKDTIDFFSAFK